MTYLQHFISHFENRDMVGIESIAYKMCVGQFYPVANCQHVISSGECEGWYEEMPEKVESKPEGVEPLAEEVTIYDGIRECTGELYSCGECDYRIYQNDHKFCPNCGRKILWGCNDE